MSAKKLLLSSLALITVLTSALFVPALADNIRIAQGPSKPSDTNVGDIPKPDFGPYKADLQRRIKRAWFPPKGMENKVVSVTFKLHNDGQMTELKIAETSGLEVPDNAAKAAVQNAAPFRPFPPGGPTDMTVDFTFDYSKSNGGGVATFHY